MHFDLSLPLPNPLTPTVQLCALLLLTIICATLFVLRICFGTFSLSRVLAHFEERRHLERAYALAYQRREDSIYHRDWAKVTRKRH